MAEAEAAREDGIEAVAIVTPNHMHAAAARAFLARGIHVICDKPMTSTLAGRRGAGGGRGAVGRALRAHPQLHRLPDGAAGPRDGDAAGEIGAVRVVQVEYPQDWLADDIESTGQKQAEWRTDPARTGAGGCTGDIGTHAIHLATLRHRPDIARRCSPPISTDLRAGAAGRRQRPCPLRYEGGAQGDALVPVRSRPGNENALRLRVYGETGRARMAAGGAEPSVVHARWASPCAPADAGRGGRHRDRHPASASRPGHPEGYLEGFANLYAQAADLIEAHRRGDAPDHLLPTVQDGLDGVRFIDACIRSSAADAAWVTL